VLHGHGVYSVAVSFVGRDFQPLDAEALKGLGNVPVLSVDTHEQSDKAAKEIGETLAGFPLCLVAGHGSYAWGADLEQAAGRTELLERAAKIYVVARQAAAL
jgi:L-fuculose-phosphate aldolase